MTHGNTKLYLSTSTRLHSSEALGFQSWWADTEKLDAFEWNKRLPAGWHCSVLQVWRDGGAQAQPPLLPASPVGTPHWWTLHYPSRHPQTETHLQRDRGGAARRGATWHTCQCDTCPGDTWPRDTLAVCHSSETLICWHLGQALHSSLRF